VRLGGIGVLAPKTHEINHYPQWRPLIAKVIGIDLWNYNSCFGRDEGNNSKIIENAEGASHTIVVAFLDNGEVLVDNQPAAKRQQTPRVPIYAV